MDVFVTVPMLIRGNCNLGRDKRMIRRSLFFGIGMF